MSKHEHHIPTAFRREFAHWSAWRTRALVVAGAAAAGVVVVGFTWLAESAQSLFFRVYVQLGWWLLLWTPAVTALAAWLMRRYAPGASGSGIPQVMAALDPAVDPASASMACWWRAARPASPPPSTLHWPG